MFVLVTYDIATDSRAGKKRLRHAAKVCLDYGQRVQNSVFEMKVAPAEWTECRCRLTDIIDPATDSLRFYFLGKNWRRKVEHVGAKPSFDIDGPLIV